MDGDEGFPSRAGTLDVEHELDNQTRNIVALPNGRRTIKGPGQTSRAGLIHMTYVSRAMEWVNLKGAVKEWLIVANMLDKTKQVECIIIGWRHLPSILGLIYMLKKVFYEFLVKEVVENTRICGCTHKRWRPYLDVDTIILGTGDISKNMSELWT